MLHATPTLVTISTLCVCTQRCAMMLLSNPLIRVCKHCNCRSFNVCCCYRDYHGALTIHLMPMITHSNQRYRNWSISWHLIEHWLALAFQILRNKTTSDRTNWVSEHLTTCALIIWSTIVPCTSITVDIRLTHHRVEQNTMETYGVPCNFNSIFAKPYRLSAHVLKDTL